MPKGVKFKKHIEKEQCISAGLRSPATAIDNKNDVHKKELRLKCITALPESNTKTALLLKFLQNYMDKGEDLIKCAERTDGFDHSQLPRTSIVMLHRNGNQYLVGTIRTR